MNKKSLTLFTLLLIVLGLALWYFLFPASSRQAVDNIKNILPFGSGEGVLAPASPSENSGGAAATSTEPAAATSTEAHGNLFQISKVPVAGMVVIKQGGTEVVRFVERATGHIEDFGLTSLSMSPVTNSTIPKVYEALFRPDGSSVILRTLDNSTDTVLSTSYALRAPSASSSETLYTMSAAPLYENISAIAPAKDNIFFVTESGASIISSLYDGSKQSAVFSGDFNEWTLAPAGAYLVITTRPSASAEGYSYSLSLKNKSLVKIAGPLTGLSVLPNPNFTKFIYSSFDDGLNLSLKNPGGTLFQKIYPATLAEKCVWGTKSAALLYCAVPNSAAFENLPDSWYQGKAHFTDKIWMFNTDTYYSEIVSDPKNSINEDIDAMNLALSPDEDYLVFMNKNDLTLWALKLVKF